MFIASLFDVNHRIVLPRPVTTPRSNLAALCVDDLKVILQQLLPERNLYPEDDYVALLTEILHLGIQSPASFRSLITDERDYILDLEANLVDGCALEKYMQEHDGKLPDEQLACLSHVGMARSALVKRYPNDYKMFIPDDKPI